MEADEETEVEAVAELSRLTTTGSVTGTSLVASALGVDVAAGSIFGGPTEQEDVSRLGAGTSGAKRGSFVDVELGSELGLTVRSTACGTSDVVVGTGAGLANTNGLTEEGASTMSSFVVVRRGGGTGRISSVPSSESMEGGKETGMLEDRVGYKDAFDGTSD